MTPAAILFDLGGVLLPFDRERRVRAIAARLGVDAEAARSFMALEVHRRLDRGEATELDLAAEFSAFFGRPIGPSLAAELVLSVFGPPNEALWRLAGRLRARAVVGGFSDNPALVVQAFPAEAVLEPLFLSCEMRACKPSAEAFAQVEAELGVAPERILFIDDTPANVAAARSRGWDAILFTSNEALVRELAGRGLP